MHSYLLVLPRCAGMREVGRMHSPCSPGAQSCPPSTWSAQMWPLGVPHPPSLQSKWGPLCRVQPSSYTPALLLYFGLFVQGPRPISQGPGVDLGVSPAHSAEQELKK